MQFVDGSETVDICFNNLAMTSPRPWACPLPRTHLSKSQYCFLASLQPLSLFQKPHAWKPRPPPFAMEADDRILEWAPVLKRPASCQFPPLPVAHPKLPFFKGHPSMPGNVRTPTAGTEGTTLNATSSLNIRLGHVVTG